MTHKLIQMNSEIMLPNLLVKSTIFFFILDYYSYYQHVFYIKKRNFYYLTIICVQVIKKIILQFSYLYQTYN